MNSDCNQSGVGKDPTTNLKELFFFAGGISEIRFLGVRFL